MKSQTDMILSIISILEANYIYYMKVQMCLQLSGKVR